MKKNMKRSAVKQLRFAAFAVGALSALMANAALPSGYLEFEYIQGNGSNARIVLDDYTPTPNYDKIEAVVSFPAGTLNQTQTIWCSRGNGLTTATWTLFVANSSGYKCRFDYGNSEGNWLTPVLSATDVKYTVTADGPAFTSSAGQSQTHTRVADYTAGGCLMLFAAYVKGGYSNPTNYGKFKLYSFKVWRSDTLIHDLVPSMRLSDSKPGLYDVKKDTFYEGSGTFTLMDYWNPIGYVAASPDEAKSDASAFVSFIFNKKETAPMESKFKSTKPLGFTLIVR